MLFQATCIKERAEQISQGCAEGARNLAFFQCGAKTYSEIRQHMPSKMRDELDANFGVLDGMMTKKERRLNK